MESRNYKNLIVWHKSVELVVLIYEFTKTFPKNEVYALASQMQRSAVSIPSNIAEGSRRKTQKDTHHFLSIAFGSGAELETQIEITKRLNFGKHYDFTKIDGLLEEVMKMLNKMLYSK